MAALDEKEIKHRLLYLRTTRDFKFDPKEFSPFCIEQLCCNHRLPWKMVKDNPIVKWDKACLSIFQVPSKMLNHLRDYINWEKLSGNNCLLRSDIINNPFEPWYFESLRIRPDIVEIIKGVFNKYQLDDKVIDFIKNISQSKREEVSRYLDHNILLHEKLRDIVDWDAILSNETISDNVLVENYILPWKWDRLKHRDLVEIYKTIKSRRDILAKKYKISNDQHDDTVREIFKTKSVDMSIYLNIKDLFSYRFKDLIDWTALSFNLTLRANHVREHKDKPWCHIWVMIRFGKKKLTDLGDDFNFSDKDLEIKRDDIHKDGSTSNYFVCRKFPYPIIKKYFDNALRYLSTSEKVTVFKENKSFTDIVIVSLINDYFCLENCNEFPAWRIIKWADMLCDFQCIPRDHILSNRLNFDKFSFNPWLTLNDVRRFPEKDWNKKELSSKLDIHGMIFFLRHLIHWKVLSKRKDLTLEHVIYHRSRDWNKIIISQRFDIEELLKYVPMLVDYDILSQRKDLTAEIVKSHLNHPWNPKMMLKRFNMVFPEKEKVIRSVTWIPIPIEGVAKIYKTDECPVCMVSKPDMVCDPCGHMFHNTCQRTMKCSLCRRDIIDRKKIRFRKVVI